MGRSNPNQGRNVIEVALILSTARTGTKFFEGYLNRTCPGVVCRHEPRPSRRFKFLSNMYLQGTIGGSIIRRLFLRSRRRLLEGEFRLYVESNNFLFGCVPPLLESLPALRVVHIVRHPVDYVVSHMRHGFWRGLKGFTARHVPFWLEELPLEGGEASDPVLILAARWVYVNSILLGHGGGGNYLRLRFEDVFCSPPDVRAESLDALRAFLGCAPLERQTQLRLLRRKVNASPAGDAEFSLDQREKARVIELCRAPMRQFGYDAEA